MTLLLISPMSAGPETDASAAAERQRKLVAPYAARAMAGAVDPKQDLADERKKASFDVEALSELLYDGKKALAGRRKVMKVLTSDPRLSKPDSWFLTREQRIARGLGLSAAMPQVCIENGLNFEQSAMLREFIAEPCAFDLHWGMFVTTIRGQGTEEQQAKWLTPAITFEIIGTYCQTELGHGTFVRGLETTVVYIAYRRLLDCDVLCYAMLCCAMPCYAMLCYAMLCYAVLCYAMLC